MTDLADLLDDLARTPAPASRLRPGDMYAAGRRRHRRTVTAMVTAAGAAVVTLVAGVAFATLDRSPGPVQHEPQPGQTGQPAPTEPAPTEAARDYHGAVAAAAASDPDHLYAVVLDCGTATTSPPDWYSCQRDLLASGDAGRTWQMRNRDFGSFDSIRLTALPGGVLVARAEKLISGGALPASGGYVSVDGGRTWKVVELQDAPVSQLAAGGWVEWSWDATAGIWAGDPGLARYTLMADPPALKFTGTAVRNAVGGAWWLDGVDPATGQPAVAISVDAGRNWSTHVFTDIPVAENSGYSVGSATLDGRTGYVVSMTGHGIDGGGRVWVHRTTDGGKTWQQVEHGGTAPWSYGGGLSYLTPDGGHVIVNLGGRDGRRSFSISRDGARYTQVTLAGLPEDDLAELPRPVPGGGYLASTIDAVYVSSDGLQWRRIVPHAA
ncbi:hypothetical protein [Dactylosporangium sp. NPDC005555]|uniref:hypothetical protein n=1 Tax=Dactylosporangium sp. NPDC005555 TaxID=3154889 RepID=UPI0033A7D95A